MPLERLPLELLSTTFSFLDNSTLRAVRRVSRTYSKLATKYLFRDITFLPTPSGLEKWHNIVSNPQLSAFPRHVIINTSPLPHYVHWNGHGDEYEIMSAWDPDPDDEDYDSYYSGIDALSKLSSLDSVTLRFMYTCRGRDAEDWTLDEEGLELIDRRLDILNRFFKALRQRRKDNPKASKVTSLTIKNLQNVPIEEFTTTKLFHSVMKDIEHLNLIITEEYNEPGPDHDMQCIERRTFMPHLVEHWLKPVAPHLKSLLLRFPDGWGPLPGYFDPSHLHFPQLEKLTLKRYCIAHNDSLDWVLQQKSLKSLHLKKCQISTYFNIQPEEVEGWQVRTHDWESKPELGSQWSGVVYFYPGTWADFFEKIRTGVPDLEDFSLRWSDLNNDFDLSSAEIDTWTSSSAWGLSSEQRIEVERALSCRYVVFNSGILPTPWMRREEADEFPQPEASTDEEGKDSRALRRLLNEVSDKSRRVTSHHKKVAS